MDRLEELPGEVRAYAEERSRYLDHVHVATADLVDVGEFVARAQDRRRAS